MEKIKNMKYEKVIEMVFLICALTSIAFLLLITIFIFVKGSPAIYKIGFFDFILGVKWAPDANLYGILPMITTSLVATLIATLVGGIIGISVAAFMSEVLSEKITNKFRPFIELLASIPSVVYGFFALIVLVPMIGNVFKDGGSGNSLLAVCIVLSVMILPTIINISEVSLRAVPKEYKEGSYAIGATKIQTIIKVTIPSAKSGILTAIVLGMGRAIGETMAVILVAGNSPLFPGKVSGNIMLDSIRTMTANIAIEMGYAFGLHQEALFATGVVLLVFILTLNLVLNMVIRRIKQ